MSSSLGLGGTVLMAVICMCTSGSWDKGSENTAQTPYYNLKSIYYYSQVLCRNVYDLITSGLPRNRKFESIPRTV